MKFPEPFSIQTVAEWIDAKIIGNHELMVTGINEIHKVEEGDITFSDVEKYFSKSLKSNASVIILNGEAECPPGKAILLCKDPFEAYDSIIRRFKPFQPLDFRIDPSAEIGEGTVIEPGVMIGANVVIGKDCYVQANVYIGSDTIIGDRVEIQVGAIIGTDAFYFKKRPDKYEKWTSGGRVVIENDVQIGANTTINRGVSGDTVIGEGSKLDCLIHIGHGVVLGKRVLLAGQVGIAGKTIVEDDVVMYGQVGVAHNLHIGKGAILLAKSAVGKDVEAGETVMGYPAENARQKIRQWVTLKRLSK